MNNTSSTQLHVLVTRPGNAGEELSALIASEGDFATHFPTIVFAAPNNISAMQQAIERLGEQDWLIFISPQAVYASVPFIRQVWPLLPESVQFAAMGGGTARALKEAGYLAAIQPEENWGSEGLLDAPALQMIAGKKIAIIRGEGGRDILDEILGERGAIVTHVITYSRVIPEVDASQCIQQIQKKLIDVVICTSFEGVANLKTILGHESWSDLRQVPLLVPSERIKRLANDLGFQTIWVAANASNEAISTLLQQKKDVLCRIK